MKNIKLDKGKYAVVDDNDFEWASQYKWFCNARGYAARGKRINNKTTIYLMHREIIGTPKGVFTDHINGDRLDNRRSNLRICSRAENKMNSKKPKNGKNKYKGVLWVERLKKWRAVVGFNKKHVHVGYFKIEDDAARAYNAKAIELHGEFARPNVI